MVSFRLFTRLPLFLCRLVDKKRLTLPSRATMMTTWAVCFEFTSFAIRGACRLVEKYLVSANAIGLHRLSCLKRASYSFQTHISRWGVDDMQASAAREIM